MIKKKRDMKRLTKFKKISLATPPSMMAELQESGHSIAQEISQMLGRQELLMDKQRTMDRWVVRIRRKKDMVPVWTRRGLDENEINAELHQWLTQRECRQ